MRRRFMRKQSEETKEKTVYVDANMQGTISFNDPIDLHINGKFEGKLNTQGTLVIGKQAEIVAEIFGEHITIAGTVKGNITATKKLEIVAPAFIAGNLETPVLSVCEGAIINGAIRMNAIKNAGSGSTEKIFTLDEVAKYLEVDKKLVLEWANNGSLPGAKKGNNWNFDRAIVDNWISAAKVS